MSKLPTIPEMMEEMKKRKKKVLKYVLDKKQEDFILLKEDEWNSWI